MTNAELAILSLIAEKSRHGYEMEDIIEKRGMREWTEIGFSSIYYLLKKLKREGLVESQLEEAPRGPARKVYSITEAGYEALRQGALEALANPQRSYSPIQLGLSSLPYLANEDVVEAVQQHYDELSERITEIRARRDSETDMTFSLEAMLDYTIEMLESQRTWIASFITRLGNRSTSTSEKH